MYGKYSSPLSLCIPTHKHNTIEKSNLMRTKYIVALALGSSLRWREHTRGFCFSSSTLIIYGNETNWILTTPDTAVCTRVAILSWRQPVCVEANLEGAHGKNKWDNYWVPIAIVWYVFDIMSYVCMCGYIHPCHISHIYINFVWYIHNVIYIYWYQ